MDTWLTSRHSVAATFHTFLILAAASDYAAMVVAIDNIDLADLSLASIENSLEHLELWRRNKDVVIVTLAH